MATTANEWKKSAQGVDLQVPSGNTCKARRPGLDIFVRQGVIPNSLLPIVQEAIAGKKQELDLSAIAQDPSMLEDIMSLVDVVVIRAVLEPKVHPVPLPSITPGVGESNAQRDEEKLYVDEVDFEDKMFIFQWAVGGTADLEKFREEQDATVESISPSSDVAVSPEPVASD